MDANVVDQYEEIENLDNVINIDGTPAIFLDGRYYIPTNTKAILLPESDSQYIIDNTGNILFDTNFETPFHNSETVHLVENNQVKVEDDNQILYYTDEVKNIAETKEGVSSQNVQFGFMENIDSSFKSEIGGDFINIDSVLENVNNITDTAENGGMQNYQYIVQFENYDVLKNSIDNSMHYMQKNTWDESTTVDESSQIVDISKITGKNLLTGETVTLDNYLEKVKNINKELTLEKAEEMSQNIRKRSQHTALSNLLNKKLTIGKTLTGQRLVGKVIHVGKREVDIANDDSGIYEPCLTKLENIDEESAMVPSTFSLTTGKPTDNEDLSTVILEDNQADDTTIVINNQHEMVGLAETQCDPTEFNDKEYYNEEENKLNWLNHSLIDYVSRTLTNLMSMESVSKKLKRKNLFIKVIEKIVTNSNKHKVNLYQMKGHLEMLGGWEEEGYEEKWVFKFNKEHSSKGNEPMDHNHKKFPESMRLIISIVLDDGIIQSTKVNLNYCQEKCSICSKEFRTLYKLKSHMNIVHQIAESQFYCQLCDESLDDKDMFTQHRLYHVERNELFPCSRCDKHFLTKIKLAKHMLCHDPSGLKLVCTICGENCSKVSTWKKHMLIHTATKPYSCNQCNKQFISLADLNYHSRAHDAKNCYVCKVCNRTFSRYSNMQRHSEIHGTKNSRSAYSCSMCGCTYNYVSSLTRHIVQNHLSTS